MHQTHPIPRAIILFMLSLVGIIVFSLAGFGICKATGIDIEGKFGLRIQTVFTQLGGFLLPALIFVKIFGWSSVTNFSLKKPKFVHIIITILLALVALVVIAYAGELNIALLEDRGGFIAKLKELEDQTAEVMKVMLAMDGIGSLLITIALVGVLPAICEEFLFRGALQSQLAKAFSNSHLAIWATAIIFSGIHFQFFGFLPRVLLGAFFGYILIYSGSIWLPILAHFINNSLGVIGYYVAQHTDLISEEQVESTEVSWILAAVSAAIVVGLIVWMKKTSNWPTREAIYQSFPDKMDQEEKEYLTP